MTIVSNIKNNYTRIRRYGIHKNTPRVQWKSKSRNVS